MRAFGDVLSIRCVTIDTAAQARRVAGILVVAALVAAWLPSLAGEESAPISRERRTAEAAVLPATTDRSPQSEFVRTGRPMEAAAPDGNSVQGRSPFGYLEFDWTGDVPGFDVSGFGSHSTLHTQ